MGASRMRIALALTYPIYHDGLTTHEWRRQTVRERLIAGFLALKGHHVELWALGRENDSFTGSEYGSDAFQIRLFQPDRWTGRTRNHYSSQLVRHARSFDAHLHILKGVDGGSGRRLIKHFLSREEKNFVFIVGGRYDFKYVSQARLVFCETEKQIRDLHGRGMQFWRKSLPSDRLMIMPKVIDTEVFSPELGRKKEWDMIVVGRLIDRLKNFDVLGTLSKRFKVAVAGSGRDESRLKRRFKDVTWLGRIFNPELPSYLNRSRVFLHTGLRDYYPRVIPEAMACGLPCLAFRKGITSDVIPPGCGLLLPRKGYIPIVAGLIADQRELEAMGRRAREWAVEFFHRDSFQGPVMEMLDRLKANKNR
jgi:glycosyltransferase involved in cell wall biosynthesis